MDNPIHYTHKKIVEASKQNNRKAQYKLYELYINAMYNTSVRFLQSREDAEDVVQDSFVEAFKKLHTFRYESSFGAWLKRIVINKSINYLKAKQLIVIPLEEKEYQIKEKEIQSPINYKPDLLKVKKGISKLPDGYRTIITLYLIEGFDHVEIAQILDINVSTSKSQYHRAKKKLIDITQTL